MTPSEFDAGDAVRRSSSTSRPIPEIRSTRTELFGRSRRLLGAQAGQRIVSVSMSPTRHTAVVFGREGSGYVSEMAITVVYASASPSA
jgi:hypothetical protein